MSDNPLKKCNYKVITKRKEKGFDILAEAEIVKSYNLEPWRLKIPTSKEIYGGKLPE